MRLTVAQLHVTNYGFMDLQGFSAELEVVEASILAAEAAIGVSGQGAHFPKFTEQYLKQDLHRKTPTRLLHAICQAVEAYLKAVPGDLDLNVKIEHLNPVWGNVNRSGDFHSAHNHALGECVLAGVLFVAIPPNLGSGEGLLVMERTTLPAVGGRFDLVHRPDSKIFVAPRPGRLVLFPPYVRHYVTPHLTPSLRISLSFNVSGAAVVGRRQKGSSEGEGDVGEC